MIRSLMSGEKRNYYGKGETVVYRLRRNGGQPPILGASLTLIVWGDAFWPTYTTGDNTGLIATDSMKNFLQRETLNYEGDSISGLARFLLTKFLDTYPQVEGAELYADEVPYEAPTGVGFRPSSGPRRTAKLWMDASGVREAREGLAGYELLRLRGSAFHGFVRDQYTTLPDLHDRPLRMKLALEWSARDANDVTREVQGLVHEAFEDFESGSIQQVLYHMGRRILGAVTSIDVLDLEGQNHTWDGVTEGEGGEAAFTISKPFYGILGLRLTRADLED